MPQDEAETTDLEKLTQELEIEKNAKLMALADFDNYRKRVEKERSELMTLANMSIIRALADLIDDFERIVNDLEKPNQEDKIDAFKPVLDKAKGILVDYGVVEIELEEGAKFDPQSMEAIGTVVVTEDEKVNTVVHIAQKGYKLRDKDAVIRHARVLVGKK